MSNVSHLNRNTKAIAAIAIFSALYAALRIIPTVPMVGTGATFRLSDILAPLFGVLLGPYVGGVSIIIGTFAAIGLGTPAPFFGLDFLPALVVAVSLGFLVRRKWLPVVILNALLLVGYAVNPLTSNFISTPWGIFPYLWMHIIAFIVLISPLGHKSGEWVANVPEESLRRETVAGLVSLIAGFFGVVIGAILVLTTTLLPDFSLFGILEIVWLTIGLLSIICGTIIILAAFKLNSNPQEHKKWGIIILVASLIGLGSILGFIGGILAWVHEPKKTNLIKSTKFTVGFISLAFIGTMMQHLTGGILYEVILGQITNSVLATSFPGIWNVVFYLYPWERLALIVGAMLIGVPVTIILRKSLFPPETKPVSSGKAYLSTSK